jgi:hypothetical protein
MPAIRRVWCASRASRLDSAITGCASIRPASSQIPLEPTYNNAFATWEEKVKGSIEPGKLADFLVLSGDFMTIPEDEILKLHPMATYVGGRKVYAAPEANGAF